MRTYQQHYHFRYLFFVLVGLVVLTACDSPPQEPTVTPTNEPSALSISENASATPTVTITAAASPTSTPTPTLPSTPTTSATASLIPLPTHTPTPTATPIPPFVRCNESSPTPLSVSPDSVDISHSHIVVEQPYMYMATEHFVSMFDLTDPIYPRFYGFWDLGEIPEITGLVTYNRVIYVSSGNTVYALNSYVHCRFALLTQLELPFPIDQLELSGGSLYVGGRLQDEEQIALVHIVTPTELELAHILNLRTPYVLWSLHEGKLYFVDLPADEFWVLDATASTRDDAQILSADINLDTLMPVWLELRGNVLYSHSEQIGFTIMTALPDQLAIITQGPPVFPLMGYDFQVQTEYIFLGTTFCEVTCTGSVTLFNAITGREYSAFSTWPFYPVVRFIQTQDNLIYAFTEDSPLVKDAILVIDLTKPEGDLVINWLTLIIP